MSRHNNRLSHPITIHRGNERGKHPKEPMRDSTTVCPTKYKRVPSYVKRLREERARKLAARRWR